MKFNEIKKLLESNLAPAQLVKSPARLALLMQKIKTGSPFTLQTGESVVVDKNEANEPPPTIDPRAEGDHPLNEKVDQNLRATKRFTRRVMAVRVLFLLSGIAVLVSGM